MKHAAAFKFFADLIKQKSGITLREDKLYLVETRLADICRQESCADITELHRKIGSTPPRKMVTDIVESITTNETWWFRDGDLFNTLKSTLWPAYAKKNLGTVNMWCAASSTGQEPYTLRMTWESSPLKTSNRLKMMCTDIDNKALARCKEGVYSQLEIGRGLPTMELISFFDQSEDKWKVKPVLQQDIEWRQLNLMDGPPMRNFYDIVLCRNVLIYFDPEGKNKVVEHIMQSLKPEGLLFLGGSESLFSPPAGVVRTRIGKLFAYGRQAAVDWAASLET